MSRDDEKTAREIFFIRGHNTVQWYNPLMLKKEKRKCRDAAKILNDFLDNWEQSND